MFPKIACSSNSNLTDLQVWMGVSQDGCNFDISQQQTRRDNFHRTLAGYVPRNSQRHSSRHKFYKLIPRQNNWIFKCLCASQHLCSCTSDLNSHVTMTQPQPRRDALGPVHFGQNSPFLKMSEAHFFKSRYAIMQWNALASLLWNSSLRAKTFHLVPRSAFTNTKSEMNNNFYHNISNLNSSILSNFAQCRIHIEAYWQVHNKKAMEIVHHTDCWKHNCVLYPSSHMWCT